MGENRRKGQGRPPDQQNKRSSASHTPAGSASCGPGRTQQIYDDGDLQGSVPGQGVWRTVGLRSQALIIIQR